MAKKERKFEHKQRGRAAFIKQNKCLIANVAKEHGLMEKREVVVNPMKSDATHKREFVPAVISDELINLAKKKIAINGNDAPVVNRSPLRKLWAHLEWHDSEYGTQLHKALTVWIQNNPKVKELRTRERLKVLVDVVNRMKGVFTTVPQE